MFLRGAGPGVKGGSFIDTTVTKGGQTIHINTVSTLANGVTPTADELVRAVNATLNMGGDDILILIPKGIK